jgi:hypothetical protein
MQRRRCRRCRKPIADPRSSELDRPDCCACNTRRCPTCGKVMKGPASDSDLTRDQQCDECKTDVIPLPMW